MDGNTETTAASDKKEKIGTQFGGINLRFF